MLTHSGMGADDPAAFDHAKSRIVVNLWAGYWDDPEFWARRQHSEGWWSTSAADRALVREVGHANHFAKAPDLYRKLASLGDVDTDAFTKPPHVGGFFVGPRVSSKTGGSTEGRDRIWQPHLVWRLALLVRTKGRGRPA